MTRCRIVLVLSLALFFGGSAPPAQAADPARKPNVLIVLIDDQGYGDLSCHGNPVLKTPNLDKLHHESVRFTDFHVCPMCTPTRGQIMTGRDCLANGAMNVSSGRTPLRRDMPTMADVFGGNGYRTGHYGKWHLGDNYPYRPHERGFQDSICCKSWGMYSAADYWNNDCFDDWFSHNGKNVQLPGYNTDVFFTEAMRWMKSSKDKGEPFFVYLPTTAVHAPLFVPDKYRQPYKKSQKPNVASFFGMMANVDENMGKLDAFLKTEGLFDNTLLVYMTDNGGTAGVPVFNAGMRGRKTEYYEGGHRVPCFVRWPNGKLRPAGDVATLSECQDLLPTLIELVGLKKPEGVKFDGSSLAGLLRGGPAGELAERVLTVQYSWLPSPRPKKGDACVMYKRWRLVFDKELYNLETDFAQKDNVIEKNPDVVKKMRAHYDRWWAGVEKGLDEFQPIHVGSDAENPVRLAPGDWQDVHLDQSLFVRQGVKKNGPWGILVERAGEYEIELRRWPVEADLAITAASPEYKCVDGVYPAGTALPITKARLRVGDFDNTQLVKKDDKASTFVVKLKAGRTQLQTWFLDGEGKELCGAYYTVVKRK